MTNADFITAEERYSPTLKMFRVKKFLKKYQANILLGLYGIMVFILLISVMSICASIQ
jgi:hypothetical protein